MSGGEDVAWTPDGVLLTAQGSKVLAWEPSSRDSEWREIADLAATVRDITRMAVSPKGDRLAVVGADSR